MTNRVMRVRASLGLKLPDDESEKGSALIETDSSATARVDPAETLISVGLVAADAGAMAPQNTTARLAHTNARKRSLEAKARFLIGICSLRSNTARLSRHEARQNGQSWRRGHRAITLVQIQYTQRASTR